MLNRDTAIVVSGLTRDINALMEVVELLEELRALYEDQLPPGRDDAHLPCSNEWTDTSELDSFPGTGMFHSPSSKAPFVQSKVVPQKQRAADLNKRGTSCTDEPEVGSPVGQASSQPGGCDA